MYACYNESLFSYYQTRTQADMVFDLSRFLDFSLKFLDTDLEGIVRVLSNRTSTANSKNKKNVLNKLGGGTMAVWISL